MSFPSAPLLRLVDRTGDFQDGHCRGCFLLYRRHRGMFGIGPQVRIIPGHLGGKMPYLRHYDFDWHATLDRMRDVASPEYSHGAISASRVAPQDEP